MNSIFTAFVMSAIQAALFSIVLFSVVLFLRKRSIATIVSLLSFTMTIVILFALLAVAPLPSWLPGGLSDSLRPVRVELAPGVTLESSIQGPGFSEAQDRSATHLSSTSDNLTNSQTGGSLLAEQPRLASRFGWMVMFGWLLVAGVMLGMLRLLVGVFSIWRLKRNSQCLNDQRVAAMIDDMCKKMGIDRPVLPYVAADLTTAATIGWAVPVILLPRAWSNWNEKQLTSVVAHELAHISNRDYFRNLVAQLAIAFNFFNPVIHWLGKELRAAQELLADEKAAAASVGRQIYLHVMAEMAIREDKGNPGWLAQPFLPTRTTFLRRIEMLRGEKRQDGNAGRGRAWLGRIAVLAVAVTCIGIRMPVVEAATMDRPESDSTMDDAAVNSVAKFGEKSDNEVDSNARTGLVSRLANGIVSRIWAPVHDDSAERLRSIAIAMHNYNDANGHLPAASMVAEGSEHLHSWRIAILPFIDGGEAIYKNYRFDESWNSEHNQDVTKDMPDVFRHKDQESDATVSSVFVVTGPSTLFEEGKETKLAEVPRMATTLMVFEAKRETHWAEPVDIEFDKTDPDAVATMMEQLLGYSRDAVIASKADGSTIPLKIEQYDADKLRAMIIADP